MSAEGTCNLPVSPASVFSITVVIVSFVWPMVAAGAAMVGTTSSTMSHDVLSWSVVDVLSLFGAATMTVYASVSTTGGGPPVSHVYCAVLESVVVLDVSVAMGTVSVCE